MFEEVARKNAKSQTLGGIALYELYKQYRIEWNMKAKNMIYSEDEKISSPDL